MSSSNDESTPPRPSSPFVELLDSLRAACAELGARWYLFGAQAALLYGASRLTADVDATVALGDRPTRTLTGALQAAGFVLRIPDPHFVDRTRVIPVVHERTQIPADIVLAGPGLEELFLERARVVDLGGVPIPVACPEDIVAMKILASRPKDLDDAVAILAAQPELDVGLVRETLRLLEQALGPSDLLPSFEGVLDRARRVTPR